MRVLVTGATGLIGAASCARLAADGHAVVAVVRPGSQPVPLGVERVVELDMANAAGAEAWLPHLQGIDAVVNCVGVLQDSPREDPAAVHVSGADALFLACEQLGLRRVIHFSAIGVDRHQASRFSTTKLAGDRLLMERDLDWVILRPSVVLGRAVFGASALFRGLAALPVSPRIEDAGKLQVVQLDDVTATVAFFVEASAPARVVLEVAGPERLGMSEIVARYRQWLGWRPARSMTLPGWLAALLYRLGDLAGRLGWRPALRSTAAQEIVYGATGDPTVWSDMTGIRPASLAAALEREAASVQERWFARTYFLKPLIFIILPLFWVATGIISLTVGYAHGLELMVRSGFTDLAGPGIIAGALADIIVGLAIAFRSTARRGLLGGVGLALFYAIAGSIVLPELWSQPLGPLLKIWPILALHLVALAILDER